MNFSQQLANQIESLTQQLNVKASENHGFAKRENDLVQHVQRLENQLQNLIQQPKGNSTSSEPSNGQANAELQTLRSKVSDLNQKLSEMQTVHERLQSNFKKEVIFRVKGEIGKYYLMTSVFLHPFQATELKQTQEKNKVLQETIGDLETKIEMSKELATNKELIKQENLVAASTSDKLAASRAMKQNKKLKNQVEEFEHAIMQLVRCHKYHFLEFCSI